MKKSRRIEIISAFIVIVGFALFVLFTHSITENGSVFSASVSGSSKSFAFAQQSKIISNRMRQNGLKRLSKAPSYFIDYLLEADENIADRSIFSEDICYYHDEPNNIYYAIVLYSHSEMPKISIYYSKRTYGISNCNHDLSASQQKQIEDIRAIAIKAFNSIK